MPSSVVILFVEEDRAVAEAVRSRLEEYRLEVRLAAGIDDLQGARVAVAVVSSAAGSPRFLSLLEEGNRLAIPILVLRLDRAPLPASLRRLLRALPGPRFDAVALLARQVLGFFALAGPPTTRSLPYDEDEDLGLTRSPREEGGAYSVPVEPDPPRSAQPAPEVRDNVHFSAYAPPAVPPDTRFLLSVWAYLERDRETVKERAGKAGRYREVGYKGSVRLARGSEVTVYLDLPGFEVDSAADTVAWEGEIGNCAFSVRAPAGLAPGPYTGTAKLLVSGVQVGRLLFEIEVGPERGQEAELPSTFERVETMFASYSSQDRIDVLRFQQGAQAAGVDVFVDVLSLRQGEDWPERLEREVVSRDRFCLFWSANASKSEWVEKEWRAAYKAKGIEYIHPVPLSDPRDVPPPPELGGSKHFNDLSQIVIAYEKLRKGEASKIQE